jgi:hypothetical protein
MLIADKSIEFNGVNYLIEPEYNNSSGTIIVSNTKTNDDVLSIKFNDVLGEATTTVYENLSYTDYPLPNDLYKKVSDGDFTEVVEWCLSTY